MVRWNIDARGMVETAMNLVILMEEGNEHVDFEGGRAEEGHQGDGGDSQEYIDIGGRDEDDLLVQGGQRDKW